jgi:hypothetical protein
MKIENTPFSPVFKVRLAGSTVRIYYDTSWSWPYNIFFFKT